MAKDVRAGLTRIARRIVTAMDPATRGWMVLTSGSLLRLAIGFAASVVIARSFGPSTLGVYAALAALTATAGAFTELGLTESAVRRIAIAWPDNKIDACDTAGAYIWLRAGITVLIVMSVLVLVPLASSHGLLPARPKYVVFALLGTIIIGLNGAASGLLQATRRFGRLTVVMVTNAGLTTILAVGLRLSGYLTLTTALLVLGIGTSLACLGLGWYLLPVGLDVRSLQWSTFRSEAGHLLRFGRWLWLANTMAMLAAQLDLLLAGHWLAPAAVGAYALAVSLASKANVVNQSLHAALLPFASTVTSKRAVREYLQRGLARSLFIAILLVAAIPLARPVILTVFGSAYRSSIGLFLALLGVAAVDVIAAPILMLAYSADRPRLIAAADGARVVVLVVIAAVSLPVLGAYGLVVAKFLASIVGLIVTVVALARQFRSGGASLRRPLVDGNAAVQVD